MNEKYENTKSEGVYHGGTAPKFEHVRGSGRDRVFRASLGYIQN